MGREKPRQERDQTQMEKDQTYMEGDSTPTERHQTQMVRPSSEGETKLKWRGQTEIKRD